MHRRNCLKIKAFTSRTHGNVFLRFCILSSNESPVVLDSLENCKQYKNAGKCFLVYGALNPIYDPQDWSNFKKTRNYVNTEITKKRYFHNTFEYYIENPSKTWQTINEVMSRKNNNSVILNEIDNGGTTLNDPTEVAEKFNQYFEEIVPELAKKLAKLPTLACYTYYLHNTNNRFTLEGTDQLSILSLSPAKLCKLKAIGLHDN